MLTDAQKEEIRQALSLKLAETRQSLEGLRIQSQPVSPDNAIGRVTRMDAIQQKNVAEAALRSAGQMLGKIEDALARIGQPAFGICVLCRRDIPAGRLLVMPETRVCVECAAKRKASF